MMTTFLIVITRVNQRVEYIIRWNLLSMKSRLFSSLIHCVFWDVI